MYASLFTVWQVKFEISTQGPFNFYIVNISMFLNFLFIIQSLNLWLSRIQGRCGTKGTGGGGGGGGALALNFFRKNKHFSINS